MNKPRIRDGASTQAKILKSAEKLFSKNGYSGTSIGKISQVSGISDGLILHHYKSKDSLYAAVRERVAERYNQVLETQRESGYPSAEGVRDFFHRHFRSVFHFFKKNTTYHRISLWSYLEGRTRMVEKETELTADMVEVVKAGQEVGILADDFDLIVLLTLTIGAVHFWIRYRRQFKKILGHEASLEELDNKFVNQAAMLLMRGAVTKEGS